MSDAKAPKKQTCKVNTPGFSEAV